MEQRFEMRGLTKTESKAYSKLLKSKSVTLNSNPKISIVELHKQFEDHYNNLLPLRLTMPEEKDSDYYYEDVDALWQAWKACAEVNGVLIKGGQ
jgi:hypothetical protein